MSGPFRIRYLHLFVKERSAGAFILSRNGRSADFVGGSGEDVADAIQQFAGRSDYRYFWFAYASTVNEVAQIGHAWFHRYHPTDNSSPPAGPDGSDWHCTTEGCASCALTQARR
jgi:hypothetical protein